jgi:hypothetical protein
MPTFDELTTPQIFAGALVALAICAMLLSFRASPSRKRLVFHVGSVLAALTMLLWITIMEGRSGLLFGLGPVALIIFLNLKTIKFCPKCGIQNRNPYFFPVPKYCTRCSTPLDRPHDVLMSN